MSFPARQWLTAQDYKTLLVKNLACSLKAPQAFAKALVGRRFGRLDGKPIITPEKAKGNLIVKNALILLSANQRR